MKNLESLFIFLWFYIGWFACVFLAQSEFASWLLLFPGVLLCFLIYRKQFSLKIFIACATISIIGILFDFLLLRFEWTAVYGQTLFLIPTWLMSIWLLFSLSMINLGTRLKMPLWLAAILGFFMGPLSYKSGEMFQVLTFTSHSTILIYAIFWMIFFPIVLLFSRRYA